VLIKEDLMVDWDCNQMHGKGEFLWPDGRKYVGEYVNDKKEGYGQFTWPDGRIYDGDWANGKQNGLESYISGPGKAPKKGEWKEGKRVKWLTTENEVDKNGNDNDNDNE